MHEVEALGGAGSGRSGPRTPPPLRLHHLREAVDDDVKERADAQADDGDGHSEPKR
jgi:hypothetical protein